MGKIRVRISGEYLKQAIGLNTSDYGNVDIVAVYKCPEQYDTVIITIDNDKFPSNIDGEEIPFATPIVRKEITKIIDWNIDK